jgi:hypothetical protein
MNRIRRTLTALAILAGALLAFTAMPTAAFAVRVPPPGGTSGPAQVHSIVGGGTPGWQITLIAAAAALAVLLDRTRAARKTHATTA